MPGMTKTSKFEVRVLFAAVVIFASMLQAAPAVGVDLAAMQDWDIVTANDAIPSEVYAAKEFQKFFAEASGVKLPIVTAADRPDGHVFIGLGEALRSSNVGFATDEMGDEDLRIIVRDGNIAIAGGRLRGTLYGVYTFLEDYLGVRFLTHDHTHVPPVGDRRVVKPVDRSYHPPLKMRLPYAGEIQMNPVFAARLRCNTVTRGANLGGVTSMVVINHSFTRQISSRKYGREHPEYYCLINGKRLAQVNDDAYDNEPCLTNPNVLKIVTQAVLEEIKQNPHRENFSVSQNDNDKYCRCRKCAAIDRREGTPMGSILTFVNAVADKVAKTHPNVKIGTLSYWYSRKPPKRLKPRPNVMIQLCSIECSVVQPIKSRKTQKNALFYRDLVAWGRICDKISIWNYNTNFRNYLLPCPNLRVIEPNIRLFVANKAVGVLMQGPGGALGGEMSDLRNYVTSRLLWDCNLSGNKLISEFLRLHYGKAAKSIGRFIKLVHDNAEARGITQNCFGDAKDYGIDKRIVQAGLKAFARARRLADDDVVLARVEKASVCAYRAAMEEAWLWMSANKNKLTQVKMPPRMAKRTRRYTKRLFELCEKHGVTNWSEVVKVNTVRELMRKAYGLKEGESF